METPQVHQVRYNALVDSLLANFQPVRRLWPVKARLALWLILAGGMGAAAALLAPRPDLLMKMQSWSYLLELGTFACASILAAGLALRSAIPGDEATRSEIFLIFMVAVVGISFVLHEPIHAEVPLNGFIRAGWLCMCCTYVLAAPSWLALLWAVRRGIPLAGATSGGLIGAAALLFTFSVTRLRCPVDDGLHILTWHVLPILVGTALSVLVGMALLPRRRAK
jgi:hypothetical protein